VHELDYLNVSASERVAESGAFGASQCDWDRHNSPFYAAQDPALWASQGIGLYVADDVVNDVDGTALHTAYVDCLVTEEELGRPNGVAVDA